MSGLRIDGAALEPRLRLALVAVIAAGELLGDLGVSEVAGADELGGYLAAIEGNLVDALAALEDGPSERFRIRCEKCGATFEWPGQLDHHRLLAHYEEELPRAA